MTWKALKIFLLLLVASNTMWAQDKQVEQFINAIYRDIVPAEYDYYYLMEKGKKTYAKIGLEDHAFFREAIQIDPTFPADFDTKFNSPDTSVMWSEYALRDAVIVPNDKVDSMFADNRIVQLIDYRFYEKHKDSLNKTRPYNEIYAPVNFKWSKAKQMKIANKYTDTLGWSIPKEREEYFHFSRPVFDDSNRFAVIRYGNKYETCIYIYRKDEYGNWKILVKGFCIA